jgi:ornithine carbamoyltransferase
MVRHFLDLFDIEPTEARDLLDQAAELKRDDQKGIRSPFLAGRTLGLLFEKPSLRTRVSFEAAIAQLGGSAIFLPGKDVGLGVREPVADFARILSQYVDALAVRTFSHTTVAELARLASVPVINALSDAAHPCQALGDALTIREALGALEGVKLVFVGDGNNVARSLAAVSALLEMEFCLACPENYSFPAEFVARYALSFPQAKLSVVHDPSEAVAGAEVIYTDVWTSMGQEQEADARLAAFSPFQVNRELLACAREDVVFLHCLPAHRGEEVTGEVLDGPRSLVIPQAANRLHIQKALLIWLLQEGQTEAVGLGARER